MLIDWTIADEYVVHWFHSDHTTPFFFEFMQLQKLFKTAEQNKIGLYVQNPSTMHQSIPSPNIPPGNPRCFSPTFIPGPGICTIWIAHGSGLLSIIISTKLSVDAVRRRFSAWNWSIVYCCFLPTKSVSKLGKTLKWSRMVLKLKLEGMTKE